MYLSRVLPNTASLGVCGFTLIAFPPPLHLRHLIAEVMEQCLIKNIQEVYLTENRSAVRAFPETCQNFLEPLLILQN